jgi:hypothetical protein
VSGASGSSRDYDRSVTSKAVLLCLLGACTDVCSFEDQVGTFLLDHPEAVNCRFAHHINGEDDDDLVGADIVHDCILYSMAGSRSFVGGYLLYGIDSGENHAFLGEVRSGRFTFTHVAEYPNAMQPVSILRSGCSDIADRPRTPMDIGLDCIGEHLVEACRD